MSTKRNGLDEEHQQSVTAAGFVEKTGELVVPSCVGEALLQAATHRLLTWVLGRIVPSSHCPSA